MSLPAVGSVWRNGDEWRRIETCYIKGCIAFSRFNSDVQAMKIDDWHRWSADAVQVWPQPETPQPVGEPLTQEELEAILNPLIGMSDAKLRSAATAVAMWAEHSRAIIKAGLELQKRGFIPTVTASVEAPQ